jgi:hypothetical protein
VKRLAPKKPVWLAASAAVGFLGLGIAFWLRSRHPWNAGRLAGGLLFGAAAALLVVISLLYPLRRPLLAFPFGTAQRWTQFHVYGGCLSFLFVLIHEGFRLPSGTVGWLLLILSAWATLSGLIGVWLQKWIPVVLASGLRVEAIFERIPELVAKLRSEANALVEGSSDVLDRFYREDVEPALAGVQVSWDYLIDVSGGRERRLAPFGRMAAFLTPEEKPRLEDLKVLFSEKLELDAQYSLQRVLRIWVLLHAPPSVLLFGLMLYHIVVNLYY